MKFDRFDFEKYLDTFYVLPTILIITNDMLLLRKNLSIQLHWLCFHFRWRWIKELD